MPFNLRNYGKTPFICFALLVVFVTTMKTASAQSTLKVYSILLSNLGSSISSTVKLVDETGAGSGSRGAFVHVVWTGPGGSFDQYATIGTRLRGDFQLYTAGAPGEYTLTVVDATKTGYTFVPTNNSKSISIGVEGNIPPTAVFNVDITSGGVPLSVNFDSTESNDLDGSIATYAWNFGDGSEGSFEANPSHTYQGIGNFTATLTVTDDMGATNSQSTGITVTDSNGGCISNCMSVGNITLSYKAKSRTMNALVWVQDENDTGVKGAEIHAKWTLPDGSIIEDYSSTGNKSKAAFTLKTDVAGLYTLTIVEVTKAGNSFDPDKSTVLTGMVEIAP